MGEMNKNIKGTKEKKNNILGVKNIPKKKIMLLVVLVVVVILIICLIVNVFTGKKTDGGKGSPAEKLKPGDVVERDSSDGRFQNLIGALLAGGGDCDSIEEFANDKKVEAKDVSSSRAFYAAVEDSFFNNSEKSISLGDMDAAVKKLFGSEYDFKPEKISSKNCTGFEYKNGKFVQKKNTCKTSCKISATQYKVVKSIEEYNKLTIDIKVLFGSNDDKNIAFYSDYQRENLVTNNFQDVMPLIDKGSTYRFVFEYNENGWYYFVSSEPVEDTNTDGE